MTRALLEPEAGTRPPRLGLISGLVLGAVAAAVLSWLIAETTTFIDEALGNGDDASLALAGLFLFAAGVVLGLVGFSGRFHPLIPGIPVIWLVVVLAPSLVGLGSPPSWMPGFVDTFFLHSAGPGVYLALGYLSLATAVAVYRRRRVWIFR